MPNPINIKELIADRETFTKSAIDRRVNRIPALEAAYIEAVELLRSIADRKWNTMTQGCDAAAAAQSAARKFLGDTE